MDSTKLTTPELARIIRDNLDRLLIFNQVGLNGQVEDHLEEVKSVSINGNAVQLNMTEIGLGLDEVEGSAPTKCCEDYEEYTSDINGALVQVHNTDCPALGDK